MGDKTEIAWTDATWNITSGCTDRLDIPLLWQRPRKIFVESMSDVYHDDVPIEFLGRLYATMARAPRHTFQVLTKRTKRRMELMKSGELLQAAEWAMHDAAPCDITERLISRWPLPNVWEGSTIVNQDEADCDVPLLLQTPAAVRWLSIEPQLEAINVAPYLYQLDWVVIGGESGPGARPFNLDWARSLIDQCRAAGVAPFFKQAGARPYVTHAAPFVNGPDRITEITFRDRKGADPLEWPEELRVREFPSMK